MKASEVILQLQEKLPELTNAFSDTIVLTSLTYAAGIVTATTPTAHSVKVNQYVNIANARNPVTISTITRVGTAVTVVTAADHDFTLSPRDIARGNINAIQSGSAESEFNGTFPLASVVNRRTYTYTVADTGPLVATGTPIVENGSVLPGFNGRQLITGIPTPTTFTYLSSIALFATASGTPIARTDARVSGTATQEGAEAAYTKQDDGNLWAFVVLSDVLASKDRDIGSDLVNTRTPTTYVNQRIAQGFTVFVFVPASQNDIGGRIARDLMEDIASVMTSALVGKQFDSGFAAAKQYVCTISNHGIATYNGAYYLHQFNFEMAADITFNDTVGYSVDVAFRDVDLTVFIDQGTQIDPATVSIDLDETPL